MEEEILKLRKKKWKIGIKMLPNFPANKEPLHLFYLQFYQIILNVSQRILILASKSTNTIQIAVAIILNLFKSIAKSHYN